MDVAVVGVGRMGHHHARIYSQIPQANLVAVVDGDEDRAAMVADQFNCDALTSVDELLKRYPDVQAVSVAVPTKYHREASQPLLERQIACLIEKPLAPTVEEARDLAKLASDYNAVLQVGHTERFNPAVRAVEAMNVPARFIEVDRVSPMTFRSMDVGVVMDMMIHDLDVVLMLMGGQEPDEIQAAGVAVVTEHEDICNARLTWHKPSGACVANITASRLALKTERVTRITGEKAYIKLDYGSKTGVIIRRTANELQMREIQSQLRGGVDLTDLKWDELVNVEQLEIDDGEPIVMEIRAFLDAIHTGSPPPIDARAGFANVRTAQRIVQAIRATMGGNLAEADQSGPPKRDLPGRPTTVPGQDVPVGRPARR